MSGQATGWVLRHGPRDRAMRAVLITIADAANRDGDHAQPGMGAMIEGSLYSEGHVRRTIAQLIEEGWVVQTDLPGPGKVAEYQVLMGRTNAAHGARCSDDDAAHTPRERRANAAHTPRTQTRGGTSINVQRPTDDVQPPTLALVEDDRVIRVFETWQISTGKRTAKLTPERRKKITARLIDYPVEDLIDAVQGWQNSAFHRGENNEGKVWNEMELVLRNGTNLETFRDLYRAPPPPFKRVSKSAGAEALAQQLVREARQQSFIDAEVVGE